MSDSFITIVPTEVTDEVTEISKRTIDRLTKREIISQNLTDCVIGQNNFSNEILINQLKKVFNALIKAGAGIKKSNEKRESAEQFYLNFKLDKYKLL